MIRFRSLAPALLIGTLAVSGPASALDVRQETSPGGIAYWLVEEPSIPIVAIEMEFDGGRRLDPADRLGLTRMLAALIDEGAGEMDTLAFSAARDRLSARFGISAETEQVEVSARSLAGNLDESVDLLATALASPRFDEEPMQRVRKQILSDIAEKSTRPDSVARDAWYAQAFPDHPWGRPSGGTIEGVSAITRDDLVAAHARQFTRANARIVIVGAVGPDAAGRAVDRLLGALPEGEPVPPVAVAPAPPPGLQVVELPVPQAVAIFGQPGVAMEDPDFYAAYVANHILGGGGFTSRLMEEVREKRGLAYGVYSYLSDLSGAPMLIGSVQTANARVSDSLDVIRAEWAKMAAGEISAEDLDKAKKYLTGAFPLRFESNARIAQFLVYTMRKGLGADYIDRRNSLIEAVTLDDVRGAAQRLFDPAALSVVVVGQPAGL